MLSVCSLFHLRVLIESDWNLKHILYQVDGDDNTVLIESDWNLKFTLIFLIYVGRYPY